MINHMCLALDDNKEDASSTVTAGAAANTTEGNSRASRESGLSCSQFSCCFRSALLSSLGSWL